VLSKRLEKFDVGTISLKPKLEIHDAGSAKSILAELTGRMIFETNEEMVADLNQVLKYDFDPQAVNAKKAS